ncbi:hypothetical protein JTB14_016613 [Gonioctena quinquepunctata]|nr:hypothetical protein JTB14_016613 [Gonioctena quinquepunctata]
MCGQSSFCRGNIVQYLASITVAISIISYGINISWTSPFLPYLTSNSSIIPTTSEEGSWCAISHLIGCPFGAFLAALLLDRIGRKNTILSMAPPVFVCFILMAYARNIWYLSFLRFIIGISDGAMFTAVPMYIGEIAAPDIRGFLSSLICVFYLFGILLINTLGMYLDIFTCSMISAVAPAVHFVSFFFMPESPYFYIKVKRFKRAERSLRLLRGCSDVAKDMEVLKEAVRVQEEIGGRPKFTDLFTVPSNRKACGIMVILVLGSKAAAKAPLTFYTKMVFEESGSSLSSSLSTITYCAVEVVVVMLTTYFIIDRFGRRYLIIFSTFGCAVTLIFLGLYFFLKDNHYDIINYLNWLPLTSLILNNVAFSIGLSFAWICYLSELFPTNVKVNALSIAEAFTALAAAVTSKFFQMTNDWSGSLSVPFLSFAVFSLIMIVFIVKYVPETKGKTLEEIQELLKNGEKEGKKKGEC